MARVTEAMLQRVRAAFAGRYAVERAIGAGGMAAVYVAADGAGRTVAVKVLHPELTLTLGPARFRREIAILGGLDHPNILKIFESGECDGLLYFTTPYLAGATLRQRMDEHGRMGLADVLPPLRDVAAAVDHAHACNIVHRDLKPENVLFDGARAVIGDFGVARAIILSGGQQVTSSGALVGSPHYMSPEQARGDVDLDGRVDVYALGCLLYEMFTGRPPFTGANRQAILSRHLDDPPPPLRTVRPDLPAHVEAAVFAALAKERERRPAGAGELVERLARL